MSNQSIHAIYENGVFRPTEQVNLPEHCEVELEARQIVARPSKQALEALFAILSERYESGERDVAARHNEHQP